MTKRNEMNEIVGTGQGVSLYGLVFLAHNPPIIFGETLKIVWRMTGSGNLTVQYFGPDKLPRTLAFGPAPHSSSTYDRPGDEWGTGFVFDQAGCWHLHFERTVGVADVFLRVGGA